MRYSRPPMRAHTDMLVSKKPDRPNTKPGRPNSKPGRPNMSPNPRQQNIQFMLGTQGCVRAGHVDFMLFVSCYLALATQPECYFWWNMGFRASRFNSSTSGYSSGIPMLFGNFIKVTFIFYIYIYICTKSSLL